MITFLQQDNIQLKVKQLFLSKPRDDVVVDDEKEKATIVVEYIEDKEVYIKPRKPNSIGLKIKETLGSEPSPPLGQPDFEDTIAAENEKEKELWCGRINEHLEIILNMDNRDPKLQRLMESHYCTRNMVCHIMVKT